ncbi:MAG: LptF/LptG family permease [Alphaproteobacteria bacterium]|nr:LptF/LptG family permease [Alphaproteobacteria bacterium]
MNSIIFRYLLKNFVVVFIAALAALAFVVMLFDMIDLLRASAKREHVAFTSILLLTLLKLPQTIQLILPFIVLLAGLIFGLKMSRTSELVVMRSVGLSVWNLILPVISSVFLLGVVVVTIFNPFSSLMAERYARLSERVGMTYSSPFSWTEDGLWLREVRPDNTTMVLRANRIRNDGRQVFFSNPSVFELSAEGTLLSQTEGKSGVLQSNAFVIRNAFVIYPDQESGALEPEQSFQTDLDLEKILEKFDDPNTMSFWRFPRFIGFLKEAGFATNIHEMYFHELLAMPIVLVAMVLVAIAFALPQTTRQGHVLARAIGCLACGFFLYFSLRVTGALGISNGLPMALAAFGPAVIGIFLSLTALLHFEDG